MDETHDLTRLPDAGPAHLVEVLAMGKLRATPHP